MKRTALARTTPLKRTGPPKRLGPPRAGKTLACAHCGEPFYVSPSEVLRGRQFCSNRCNGLATRKQRECVVCGATFEVRYPRKTCGAAACVSELKSRSKRGALNPRKRPEHRYKGAQTLAARRAEMEAGLPLGERNRKCHRPGCQNRVTGQAYTYCSPRCHYADRARRQGHRRVQPYHRCVACSVVFAWNGKGKGACCSARCSSSLGARRVNVIVVEVVQLRGYRKRDFADPGRSRCRCCGDQAQHQHHVVLRQHVERANGDSWHPDNALALCRRCHMSIAHTYRLPVGRLRDENFRFAKALLGPAAYDYFCRYYVDDSDPRLEALLDGQLQLEDAA